MNHFLFILINEFDQVLKALLKIILPSMTFMTATQYLYCFFALHVQCPLRLSDNTIKI